MIIEEEDYLEHYGTPRHSGRYPWGSENNVPETWLSQRNMSFLDMFQGLKMQGLSEPEIATAMNIGTTDKDGNFRPSTTQLRAKNTIAKAELKQAQITMANFLKEKGWSNNAIAERMGLAGESSVRALTAPGVADRVAALTGTSDMLRRQVDEKGLIDVGAGTEYYINSGISAEKLRAAVSILKEEGYEIHTVPIRQLGTDQETKTKVLAPPGTTWGDVMKNRFDIKTVTEFSEDGGRTFTPSLDPLPVDPKRVAVNYKEDGGAEADGVIYIRPGVEDISIGDNAYAQVRIQVGEDKYLKGMAVYKDDLPPGTDLLFNTNKSKVDNDKMSVMKDLKSDDDLPFGSIVRQIVDKPGSPDAKVISAMNIVGSKEGSGIEGGWETWSKTLASQMLSKQPPTFAKERLDATFDKAKRDLDEINDLTNPTVKKLLLEKYADSVDSSAVHLEAAHMPRQATRVLLPVNSLKSTEVYAPGFNDGEPVVLIRYPHGGTFEIPELTVNNRNRSAKKLLGDAKDAIGINHKVAEQLSGADFDGDTVVVIPNREGKIKTSNPLKELKDFDPQMYKIPDNSPIPRMTAREKGLQMGRVSNLITDMTIRGASHSEISRAVKHSMVVIDAEKHNLNWRESERRNGIAALMETYQGKKRGGASTLLSRATAKVKVPDFKPRPMSEGGPIDKATGRKVYVPTGKTNADGKPRLKEVRRLAIEDDADALVSDARTRMEVIYAQHSNRLKGLANEARLSAEKTPRLKYNPSSKKVYAKEVESLNAKLALAKRNAPRERQAQLAANAIVKAKRDANPDLEGDALKKVKFQALEDARARMGAGKQKIEFTDREWEAIQAGAISDNMLDQMLRNADTDVVRKLATPRTQTLMSPAKARQAQALLSSGSTRAEVAKRLGVSVSTLDRSIYE